MVRAMPIVNEVRIECQAGRVMRMGSKVGCGLHGQPGNFTPVRDVEQHGKAIDSPSVRVEKPRTGWAGRK